MLSSSSFDRYSRMDVTGPGLWFSLHLNAIHASTELAKRAFAEQVKLVYQNLRCLECREHLGRFIATHPLGNYWYLIDSRGRSTGMFQWTWELHNEVNRRLGKSCPSFEEAYNYFSHADEGVCTSCGGQSSITPPEISSSQPPVTRTFISPESSSSSINYRPLPIVTPITAPVAATSSLKLIPRVNTRN